MRPAPWIRFVSGRWFSSRRESGGSASSVLAAAGIAVGVAALIVVLAVMNGFQMGFIDSILEIASFHIRIDDPRKPGPGEGEASPDEALLSRIAAEKGVRSILPFAETRCLIETSEGRSMPLSVRLLPADAERRDPALAPALGLVPPILPVAGAAAPAGAESASERDGLPQIVLGAELARYLALVPGSVVEILVVRTGSETGVETEVVEARVARTFRSGYYDFDFGMAFASLELSPIFFGAGATVPYVYGLKLADRLTDASMAGRLREAYGIEAKRIEGWRDYNRAFFGALRTEKTVMMLLIGLIFVVVGFNIFHAMRRAVAERMEDIAVLRAMGASAESLSNTFVLDGLAIGAGGSFVGLVLGLLIAVNVNQVFALTERLVNGVASIAARLFGGGGAGDAFRVFSPQYFYLMEVPVRLLFPETLFVVAVATASAAAAARAAAARVSRLRPAEVLRYE